MLNENEIRRFKRLAGINEGITLTASSGRSDRGTLGWHVENYLLELMSQLLSTLDAAAMARDIRIAISQSHTKISDNVLSAQIIIQNTSKEILLTATVNLETNASTTITFTHDGVTDKYDMASKHSLLDRNAFIENISQNIINAMSETEEK